MNGLDGCGNLAHTGIRTPDHLARTDSLYRLSYPGSYIYLISISILYSLSRQDLQTLPFRHILIPKRCIHFAYLAHSTYSILPDRYTCQRRVTWQTRQRSCGAMRSKLSKHKPEFSQRVKHKPIKEFMRKGQNGVNDEQYPRQIDVCLSHNLQLTTFQRECCKRVSFGLWILLWWSTDHENYYSLTGTT
jgi:hypothetical protein